MNGHEFLTAYQAKALEYGIAVAYLLLFVPFWRFVNGTAQAQPALAVAKHRRAFQWFSVPDGLHFHPGHTWVREEGELVRVGIDDFAQKLVGPLAGVELPELGMKILQGERAFRLRADGREIDVTVPIDGTIVAANHHALDKPDVVGSDPYGAGWLVKVRPLRAKANLHQLLSGAPARKWMEGVAESLFARMTPELGMVMQDGGQPVHGIARELSADNWDEICRAYLLTE